MSFTKKIALRNTIEMHLITTNAQHDRPVFFFLALTADMAKTLRIDLIRKDCDLTQYGIICHSGYGVPSKEVIARVTKTFVTQ